MTCFCRACVTHGMFTPVEPRRHKAGFDTCLPCGEREARQVKHTIVPMHKSNYMVVSDKTLLTELTRPGRGSNH